MTCPHCWESFPPEDILWISEHSDLLGDPLLGRDEMLRFLPTRFNVAGDALDAQGTICKLLACPKCHLQVPRPLIELEPHILSIFGAPGSGKSFFLAAMTWHLRQTLSRRFNVSFTDADPQFNLSLNEYEEALFLNPYAGNLVPLADLIRKTEEQGELYNTVTFGTQSVSYPRPFLFVTQPQPGHPYADRADRLGRVVCLYDNAGESFQPGKDSSGSPVTRHLAQSRALMFVFDPTQDSRFRQEMLNSHPSPPTATSASAAVRMGRQEMILQEAATRVRRHAHLRQTEKHQRPLIVVVTKYDEWSHLLAPYVGDQDTQEPLKTVTCSEDGSRISVLDLPRIERYSQFCRKLLANCCPEIISSTEEFCQDVLYVPVSSVGWNTSINPENNLVSIRPADTQPFWVTVPFLYAMHRSSPGLIGSVKRKTGKT